VERRQWKPFSGVNSKKREKGGRNTWRTGKLRVRNASGFVMGATRRKDETGTRRRKKTALVRGGMVGQYRSKKLNFSAFLLGGILEKKRERGKSSVSEIMKETGKRKQPWEVRRVVLNEKTSKNRPPRLAVRGGLDRGRIMRATGMISGKPTGGKNLSTKGKNS